MIMGDKSISVVLHSDGGNFNIQTLEVWFKVLMGYKAGGEIILVSFGGNGEVEAQFQARHADDGMRIVSILSEKPCNWTNIMKEVQYYIDGNYVWCSPSYTYPNGDIMGDISKRLNDKTLYILHSVYIDSPFDYSTMRPLAREPNDVLFRPPSIDIESFTVEARAFKDIASILRHPGVGGVFVAEAWNSLLGIQWEYSEKVTVFSVNNL